MTWLNVWEVFSNEMRIVLTCFVLLGKCHLQPLQVDSGDVHPVGFWISELFDFRALWTWHVFLFTSSFLCCLWELDEVEFE